MNSLPQQVTIRYAANLLRKGSNDAFDLLDISRNAALHDELVIGFYYDVTINRRNLDRPNNKTASGVTPIQALQRALGKAGVTFR